MEPSEWQKWDGSRPIRATRRELDRAIAALAGKQKQLIRSQQLAELGQTRRGSAHRVDAQRLFRVHDGVFCLHPPPYSRHQQYLAAVYACGRGSFISDEAAAWLLSLREHPPSQPILTKRTGAGRGNDAFTIHRRTVEARDVFKWNGIPCTRPERTILDCAAHCEIEELEMLLMAADSGKPRLKRPRLEQLVAANAGRRGIRNLRELITDDPKETDSINERRMLKICRRFGVPEPETQYPITAGGNDYRADFAWPSLRLVVEADSWRWHGGKLKTEDDRERDQLLTIAGWIVVHFTRNQIKLEPEKVGPRLVALITGVARPPT